MNDSQLEAVIVASGCVLVYLAFGGWAWVLFFTVCAICKIVHTLFLKEK